MDNSKKIILENIDEKWFKSISSKKRDIFYLVIKRTIDIILGSIGFIIFAICLPFFALATKLDSKGPVFYCHYRVGKNGKLFNLYKFRSMHDNSAKDEKTWREKDVSSVTRVGKFLRRTHLDELPQAINILKGDISFVGPRAEWVEFAKVFEKEIPFYKYRYLVKPGLIGWAQINYPPSKSVNEAREKFEYDLYYIKNQSILLDLEIIIKSPKLFLW
ncbi:MAG: sugar transferase [Candidatus Staskawiczbacteria bacterium]|nr:sugar transferase [Candidatus Staskawiczbacteria bacterium]